MGYIVKAIDDRNGKAAWAAPNGGPTREVKEARVFPLREQALDIAAEIEGNMRKHGFSLTVSVEEI